MARQFRKKGMVTIHGFAEMAELLQKMIDVDVDTAADKVFDECCDIVKQSMDAYIDPNVPADLAAKKTEFRMKHGNVRMFAYGFSDQDPESKLKACYLNYGTPKRFTNSKTHVKDARGQWATTAYRGEISPRGFISNGKRSAAQKINAKKKAMLKELLGGGKK